MDQVAKHRYLVFMNLANIVPRNSIHSRRGLCVLDWWVSIVGKWFGRKLVRLVQTKLIRNMGSVWCELQSVCMVWVLRLVVSVDTFLDTLHHVSRHSQPLPKWFIPNYYINETFLFIILFECRIVFA